MPRRIACSQEDGETAGDIAVGIRRIVETTTVGIRENAAIGLGIGRTAGIRDLFITDRTTHSESGYIDPETLRSAMV